MTKTAAFAVAGCLFLMGLGAARLWAKKSPPEPLLRYKAGDSWSLQDTLRAQIPDPQTGTALTPTTQGVFRYEVERELEDGSLIVVAKVVSLAAGSSVKRLNPVSVDHPEKPGQAMLVSRDGTIYGPYLDPERKKALSEVKDLAAWLEAKPQKPWIWYKVSEGLKVGGKADRTVGEDLWKVRRLDDEIVGGVSCAVYEARLAGSPVEVSETTWFAHSLGYPVKRQVVEKRPHDVSSTLMQVRL